MYLFHLENRKEEKGLKTTELSFAYICAGEISSMHMKDNKKILSNDFLQLTLACG